MRIEPYDPECHKVPLRHPEHGSKTNPDDTRWLVWKAAQFPGDILEIGCHRGHTTYEWAVHQPRRQVWAVDWAENQGLHDWQLCDKLPAGEICERARYCTNVRLVLQDSKTLQYPLLSGISFVFIDGDHSLDGVRADTENVLAFLTTNPKVRKPACVVWHDYSDSGPLGVGPYLRSRMDLDLVRVEGSTLVYMEMD